MRVSGSPNQSLGLMNKLRALLIVAFLLPVSALAQDGRGELVVLLHGLARSSNSMGAMATSLEAAGFEVCNVGYPSTDHSIGTLTAEQVLPDVLGCVGAQPRRVNFVTHSLGGIIVRQLKDSTDQLSFGRVVMLGPPNGGSEVVDKLGGLAPFGWINGPAGQQLGTGEASVPKSLGATDLELGVIAGRNSINPILSWLIPGQDDGKVSINNAKIKGMRDFLVVPVSHPFLMKDKAVIRQTIHFLRSGVSAHDAQQFTAGRRP
jgi:pimeloyl-ACP methyl ester carboxylesterase